MGAKGGGGRVGYGTAKNAGPKNKGPKNLGGSSGAGGKIVGGGTVAVLHRIGNNVSLANFARHAGLNEAQALAEAERLVASGQAEYTYLSAHVAAVLKGNGKAVPEHGGLPIRGFKLTGVA